RRPTLVRRGRSRGVFAGRACNTTRVRATVTLPGIRNTVRRTRNRGPGLHDSYDELDQHRSLVAAPSSRIRFPPRLGASGVRRARTGWGASGPPVLLTG